MVYAPSSAPRMITNPPPCVLVCCECCFIIANYQNYIFLLLYQFYLSLHCGLIYGCRELGIGLWHFHLKNVYVVKKDILLLSHDFVHSMCDCSIIIFYLFVWFTISSYLSTDKDYFTHGQFYSVDLSGARYEIIQPPSCLEQGKVYTLRIDFNSYRTGLLTPDATLLIDSVCVSYYLRYVPEKIFPFCCFCLYT